VETETPDIGSNIDDDDSVDDGESDTDGEVDGLAVMKFHRLGRVSFRTVKNNRDYLGKRKNASWMYIARLAAAKEFHYAKLLHGMDFPVPKPIDSNRHCVVMSHVPGKTLYQVNINDIGEEDAEEILAVIYNIIHRLGCVGIIHGDLNEFNLIVNVDSLKVTVIDFPQIVHMNHENAEFYFNRDVEGVTTFFHKKFGVGLAEDHIPTFAKALVLFERSNRVEVIPSFKDNDLSSADDIQESATVVLET
jgi:RIO kinase 2